MEFKKNVWVSIFISKQALKIEVHARSLATTVALKTFKRDSCSIQCE